jgi:hypothetical protein
MSPTTVLILAGALVLSGCETTTQRRAAEARKTTQEGAQEISRICALPQPEREAQLKKLEIESGVVLFCGN